MKGQQVLRGRKRMMNEMRERERVGPLPVGAVMGAFLCAEFGLAVGPYIVIY